MHLVRQGLARTYRFVGYIDERLRLQYAEICPVDAESDIINGCLCILIGGLGLILRVRDQVFRPAKIGDELSGSETLAKAMISQAVSRWLDQRVVLQELTVTASNSALIVDLVYRAAGTQDPRRLRFERKGG